MVRSGRVSLLRTTAPSLQDSVDEVCIANLRILVCRGDGLVPGRRGRRRGTDLALFARPAGLFSIADLRTAGDDPRACGRGLAVGRIPQGAPSLPADPGSAEARHQLLPRGRGQEFLRAWWPGL